MRHPTHAAPAFIIPGIVNIVILCIASALCAALLFITSHSNNLVVKILCAWLFSFSANTIFSLLHEAVHGLFSSNKNINAWAGRFAAAWFPTGLAMQRSFHLTHHQNNRSKLEQFDVIHDGDILWLKYAQWYAIMTGIYWLVTVIGVVVMCLIPRHFFINSIHRQQSHMAMQTSASAYLQALETVPPWLARAEILCSVALQGLLFWLLDLSFSGWVLCYAAFAISWSSLQYTDHAFSPLDQHKGAWNLRVGYLGRFFFLNYHAHLAHHQHPRAPWNYLPSLIDVTTPRPHFFSVWWAAWKGPRRLEDSPRFDQNEQP